MHVKFPTEPMKIVHLSDYYQPQVGYQEAFLAQAHARKGHEVHVVTSDRYYPFFNYDQAFKPMLGERILGPGVSEEDGVNVHRLPVWYERPTAGFILLKGISKLLKELKPDIVVSHGIITPNAYFSGKLKKKLKYKLIYDNHAAPFNTDLNNTPLKRLYLNLWKRTVRPKILRNADTIVAIGPAEQDLASDILRVHNDDIKIIPLGADTHRFSPDESLRKKTREALGLNDDTILLIHAGKITPNKNVSILLKAFHQICKEFPQTKLILIGNGPDEHIQELKTLLSELRLGDNVIWKDFVPNKDLVNYFNAADIGVWPGNPSNIIQEAIASGLPVIIYPHPTTEFLVEKKNGFTMDAQNLQRSLSDHLRELITKYSLREKMGKKGRKFAEKHLSWDVLSDHFLS